MSDGVLGCAQGTDRARGIDIAVSRILLFHWNASEARERADRLRRAGHHVDVRHDASPAGLRDLLERLPDVYVIDLGRLPSHGREVAGWLRQRTATRRVPIVFVDGDPQKVARARARAYLPDAVFAEWKGIRSAVRRAIASPPAAPIVREGISGYSGTPLSRKLGVGAGVTVALVDAPPGFEAKLSPLPDGVRIRRRLAGKADLIALFAPSRARLQSRFPVAVRALAERGGLWIAWPKKASGVQTDLTERVVRAFGLGNGLVDHKVCAIDETWSGLRFVRRAPRRGGKA